MNPVNYATIEEALLHPKSRSFGIAIRNGETRAQDPTSFFGRKPIDDHLTFDISNNKMLANVYPNGSIKFLSYFRGSYNVDGIPGVWRQKDFSRTGPFSFTIKVEEHSKEVLYDLASAPWPAETSLLDNIIPITELDGGDFSVTLITYAPVSEDGHERLQAVVYGLLLRNKSDRRIRGSVLLPSPLDKDEPIFNRYVQVGLADSTVQRREVPFELQREQTLWVPAVICAPGSGAVDSVNARGSLFWLNQTWSYFRAFMGRLEMPQDRFTEEFFTRALCQCMEALCMDDDGNISGSSWGTYPTTLSIWMKDMYYTYLPFNSMEPDLFKKGILWFLKYSVRPAGNNFAGGIQHSLGNALTPAVMAGLYYRSTGDKSFFMENAIVKERIMALVDSMLESRSQSDAWLFPSDWISDGYSLGDYHTGSNILAWYVLQSFSRILGEVYGEREKARELAEIAEKVRKDLDRLAIVQGPFGPQYIEGVNKDGKAPCLGHDGEESDTTLAPLYGLYGYDSLPFKNYTRFALSSHNAFYVPETRGLRWHTDRKTDSSFPGYITGFANVVDEESMNGENGYLTEIRKLTDVDGSIWWWPYPKGAKYGEVERCFHCGKSGWASGVFVSLFISEILGVKFDACSRVLSLRPFSPSSSFTWEGCRFGSFLFNLSYERKDDAVRVDVENLNPMEVHLKLEVILPDQRAGSTVFIDGTEAKKSVPCGTFLGRPVVVIENGLKERESRDFEIRFSEASTV